METPAITPPTTVSRSYDTPNPSSFFSYAAAGSSNREQGQQYFVSPSAERDQALKELMGLYKQRNLEKENTELIKKVDSLSFESDVTSPR